MKLNSYSLQKLGALLFIAYVFFYDLIEQVFGRNIALIMLLIAVVLCFAAITVANGRFRLSKDLLRSMAPWLILMIFFVIPRNQMLRQGNYWLTLKWILSIIIAFFVASRPGKYDRILKTIIAIGMIHVFATWLFYFIPSLYAGMYRLWGAWPTGTAHGATGYKAGLTNHYSRNAIMIVTVAIMSAAYLFSRDKKAEPIYKKRLNLIVFVFIVAALILTAKRASLLFGAIAIFVGYYVANPAKRSGRLFRTLCAVAVLAISVEVLSNVIPALGTALDRFTLIGEDTSSTNRMLMWGLALRLFSSHPIFCIGWGGFRYQYFSNLSLRRGGLFDYLDAHNVYLQMLAETGIVGTAIFLSAIIGTLVMTLRLLKRKTELHRWEYTAVLYSLMYQVFILFYCFTGNCIYDITFMHYAIAMAFAFGVNHRLQQESRNN